jgi:hypothetical protein
MEYSTYITVMKNPENNVIRCNIDANELRLSSDDIVDGCLSTIAAFINMVPENRQIDVENAIFKKISAMKNTYMSKTF